MARRSSSLTPARTGAQPSPGRARRSSPAAPACALPDEEPRLVDAAAVLERLLRHYPEPDTELAYRNAFELLVATVLSAQSTDRRVNETTPALFGRYPDAAALAAADAGEVEVLIKPTGFFRVKSKAIITLSQRLLADFAGNVPADMDALTTLPGVGRKTANVVLGHALGVPGLPVDRHVLRVAERIGLTRETTPEGVERDLCAALPRREWTRMSDALILHGRRICRPKPQCPVCEVRDICRYPFKTGGLQALDLHAPVKGTPRHRANAADRRTTCPPKPSGEGGSPASTNSRPKAATSGPKRPAGTAGPTVANATPNAERRTPKPVRRTTRPPKPPGEGGSPAATSGEFKAQGPRPNAVTRANKS